MMLILIAAPVLLPPVLYVFFLAYVALRVAERNGKLAKMPRLARWMAKAIMLIAAALDVLFNLTFGSLIFLELPERDRLLFTARCAKWMLDHSWRGDRARFFCDGWLNPIDENHCRERL